MSAVREYLKSQIVEALSKATNLPLTVQVGTEKVVATFDIAEADSPFWLAIKEAYDEHE